MKEVKKAGSWRKWLFGCALALGVCIECITLCYLRDGHPPRRDFRIEELLIDESVFPEGWKVDPAGPSAPAKAPLGGLKSIERTSLHFYIWGVSGEQIWSGVAGEQIHRFWSVNDAVEEFERQMGLAFAVGKYDTPWVVPAELPYQSSAADRVFFACSVHGSIPMCRMIGQYDEYFVIFNTHMSPDFMTYEDLERVLQAIDERMAHYLAEDTE